MHVRNSEFSPSPRVPDSSLTPSRNSARTPARNSEVALSPRITDTSPIPGSSVSSDWSMETDLPGENEQQNRTVHTNPQWQDVLRRQFKEVIVEKCSEATRNAFDDDVDIKVCIEAIK